MGGGWVERHLRAVVGHILSLLSSHKATSTHIDAVYSRKCISFILRSTFGQLLGESAQFVAAKHLCQIISQAVVSINKGSSTGSASRIEERDHDNGEGGGDKEKGASSGAAAAQLHHMVICAILEVGFLVFNLNTAALPLVVSDAIIGGGGGGVGGGGAGPDSSLVSSTSRQPPLFSALNSVLMIPQLAVRLAGVWCLRCVGLALPSQLSYLVTHCLTQLSGPKQQNQVRS